MDWIERWLGVGPDGGDGSVEWLIVLLVITAAVVGTLAVSMRARSWFRRLVTAVAPGVPDKP
ncbi:MAG TPA: hypothetical protein VMV26_12695 [Alphaproteobacteria bacterium]|jgi:hypothetical protein|nr:hypothetical protein [Alphaproteobacteria bacterium]